MTPEQFRTAFPAFENATEAVIQAALDAAAFDVDPAAFGTRFDRALGLATAHYVTISTADGFRTDGSPGPTVEANDVTARDTEHIKIMRSERLLIEQDAEQFKRTTWGKAFIQLARQMGFGGIAA